MKQKAVQLLRELSEAHGCSGCEHPVRKILMSKLKENITTDKNGNVFCFTKGKSDSPKVMLEAHMDEVGFMVQSITEDGYLKIVALGGWWSQTLLAQRVRVLNQAGNEIVGIITCKPTHFLTEKERSEVVKIKNMVVDIGAKNFEEVTGEFGINLGDTIVPDSTFTHMHKSDILLGKAFDNRVGVALLIHATQILKETHHPNVLYSVGAVQEEVGIRGVQSAVDSVNPDVAIILEGAPADDFPGSNKSGLQAILGNGVQIRLMDASAIMNRPFSNFAINVAKECSLPFQVAVRRSGGTDAKGIQFHGNGIPTIVIGVPARCIHTHNSIIHIDDYLNGLKLVVEIIKRLDGKRIESFIS